ncbi:MAG: carbohydrate porin [Oryzomonas sp.]|jgi:hypothetical protein
MKKLVNICLAFIAVTMAVVTPFAVHADTNQPAQPVKAETPDGTEPTINATPGNPALAALEALPDWFPKLLGMQFNGVYQDVPGFHNPYQGPNSFLTSHDSTQTYGLYLGSQLAPTLQLYMDAEWFRGGGVSNNTGLAGYVNGDAVRAGSSNQSQTPYVARLFLRYFLPLSAETEKVERAMDQLAGSQPVGRWEVKAGKIAVVDDFDLNRYANNNRTQFLNYDFMYNTAWDYAADTRGYSYGVATALVQPQWRLAFGVYMEVNKPNGADFDVLDWRELGYNLELTLMPNDIGTVIRLLTYINESRTGSYDEALALGRATSTTPNTLLVEKPGGTKYGFGLNFEQPLADEGETGIFGRLGWNDGSHETWAYTEADRHASLGVQVNGIHWGRKVDCVGIAYGVNGLSTQHKDYLEAGGSGFMLGDGMLNYGFEQVLEAYYRVQLGPYIQISPDFQLIRNPGYNKDRGPAEVYGLRVHVSF